MSRKRSRDKTAALFRRVIQKTLKVEKQETVSEWAEKNRVLDDSNALAGRWSNLVTPYLVEIMNTFNDPYIRRVYMCKGTQLGGTEAIQNIIFYSMDTQPAPAMMVYPSDDLAKNISNDRLQPAIRLMPKIDARYRETKSSVLDLQFTNMKLYLRGAGSPSKLASNHIRYLFFDEIDKFPQASGKEASPYDLAVERTKTFRPQEKIYAVSTPTLRKNYIWNLTENADEVKHFFVKCPHCGAEIELKWKQIKFDEDPDGTLSHHERAATAEYCCQECGCTIEDSEKPEMLRNGEWKTVKKRGVGKAKSVGYWINSLYSVFLTWADIAEEFLDDKDDPEKLQNFVNSWLAEPWEDTQLKTNEDMVRERQTSLPEFTVPEWAKMLTGGVDVQETSFYYTIRAWGDYSTSQNITHGQVLSFQDIEEIMNLDYRKENGEPMQVRLCLVDSGYQPDATYDFCINNSDWALPCKGASNQMYDRFKISKIDKKDSKAYGMALVIIDTDKVKDSIANRMRRENGTGSWMVYNGIDDRYCQMVTAEQKVTERTKRGVITHWVPKQSHIDNHYLDTEVYSMVAAEMCGVRTMHLESINNQDGPQDKPQNNTEDENRATIPGPSWISNDSLKDWTNG